jgi:predicted amidophosphoribosyltransferase
MGDRSTRLALYRPYLKAIDLLFPPRCVRCEQLGTHWCAECRRGVAQVPQAVCPSCGLPDPKSRLCQDCRHHPPAYDAARAAFRYSARLRPVIVALKYRPNAGLAWAPVQQLALALQAQPWNPHMTVPVPLASDRLLERGFNQADLLARPLSWLASLPLRTGALERTRATPKQVRRTFCSAI